LVFLVDTPPCSFSHLSPFLSILSVLSSLSSHSSPSLSLSHTLFLSLMHTLPCISQERSAAWSAARVVEIILTQQSSTLKRAKNFMKRASLLQLLNVTKLLAIGASAQSPFLLFPASLLPSFLPPLSLPPYLPYSQMHKHEYANTHQCATGNSRQPTVNAHTHTHTFTPARHLPPSHIYTYAQWCTTGILSSCTHNFIRVTHGEVGG